MMWTPTAQAMQGKCVFTKIRRIEYFVRSADVFLYVQRALPLLLTIGFLNSIPTARYTRCEEEEEEEEEESKKNLKIPKLIFTIDISNFPNPIVPMVLFLGGAESAPPPRPFQSILEPALKRVKTR